MYLVELSLDTHAALFTTEKQSNLNLSLKNEQKSGGVTFHPNGGKPLEASVQGIDPRISQSRAD